MSHFYTATGQLIDGLKEARKTNPQPLPSPTTVLQLIKGDGLLRYFRKQMWEAACTTPRKPEWTDDQHYKACVQWANEHSHAARDKGLAFHKLIQEFHQAVVGMGPTPALTPVPDLAPVYDLYLRWYEKWIKRTVAVEQFVVGDGYAGREDHYAILQDGRSALIDIKTQDNNGKRFNFYTPWSIQLGSYSGARPPGESRTVDCIISIAVSSTGPAMLEAKVWPREVSYYHGLFMGLLAIWREENNYHPEAAGKPVEAPSE